MFKQIFKLRKVVAIAICFAGFTFAVLNTNAQSNIWDFGVEINGLIFAKYNVDAPGTFVENAYESGRYYTWAEAQTVCPEGWRLPSYTDFKRLPSGMYTSHWGGYWVGDTIVGYGRWYDGASDNDKDGSVDNIFMPEVGFMTYNRAKDSYYWRSDGCGRYWTNEMLENYPNTAYVFRFGNGGYYIGAGYENLTENPNMCCVRCVTDIPTSAIDEVSAKTSIALHPNPTSGELRIESGEWRVKNVQMFDMAGKLIFETKQSSFNISHLPNGMYSIKVFTNKGVSTSKLIKQGN